MFDATLTVDEVMRRWPQTLPVFVRLKLNCVGCDMAPFETLADVAKTYGLALGELLTQLEQAAAQEAG
jgi:hybrid cluster-associated redox disulfide protein